MNNEMVVGTVTTVRYQKNFSWVGMVLVDASTQRKGIGMGLLTQALEILREEETVKLDATAAGREVYLKLDFADEYKLSRMQIIVDAGKLQVSSARVILKEDWERIVAFDTEKFGANRSALLKWMWEGAPQFGFVISEGNKIEGYCLGRPGQQFTQVGPVVANSISVAKELVAAALRNYEGAKVVLDAMHFEQHWLAWLQSIGFVEQRIFIRMYRGVNRFRGIPENQFAIMGPEFG